tara:strand:- start:14594 stop:15217 length:624 start_codon:yes stop_codon:yes gene_type:complete
MLVIIQARSSSKRFPKKILYKIKSIPIIIHVINNVIKSRFVSKVVVATSNKKTDNGLISILKKNRVDFYRSSLNNVALRLLNTAIKYKKNSFIRISGDSPLINFKIIDKAISIKKKSKGKFDIITNVFPRTFPSGQSVEIIKTKTLKKNLTKMSIYEKEHVTPFFYSHYDRFKIINFKSKSYKGKLKKYSVDNKKDLKNILKEFKND